jgi:NAD-dependent dihydropyrimidine dehydrogenase PreA subunit
MVSGKPEIDREKCVGCGDCVAWCPSGAVKLLNGKITLAKPEACSYCTECEAICSAGAIRCPFVIVLAKYVS